VSETLDIGVAVQRAALGDHICALYSGPAEREAILRTYVRSALLSGDKCICFLDTEEPTELLERLGPLDDLDPSAYVDSHQLDLFRAAETILRAGRFSPVDILASVKAAIASVMNAGQYPRLRFIGETSSTLKYGPNLLDVLQYESETNRMLPMYPQVIMCMYDLDTIGGSFLVDMVSTHRKLFINGMLVDNPNYLPPDEWLERLGIKR
jgi:hypothetical protein